MLDLYSCIVITVSPALTAVTVQEPNQMVMIPITFADLPLQIMQLVPFTVTYTTTNGTALGKLCIHMDYN